jgi:hypothetical protein
MDNTVRIRLAKQPGDERIGIKVQAGNRLPVEFEVPAAKFEIFIAEVRMLAAVLDVARETGRLGFEFTYASRSFEE